MPDSDYCGAEFLLTEAVRANRLQPLNTIAYNSAIRHSLEIAQDVFNECFEARRKLYE
jgi:hypothetical protein